MERSVVEALSASEPCGQDLDLEEDVAYLQFTASIDALLPDSYMQDGEDGKRMPFHATQRYRDLDINALVISGAKLLGRTHDLRLLAIVAKLHILNRSLARFGAVVSSMAVLLETFPEDVHPKEPEARAGALERLNEPLILSALNHAALFRSRRFGAVTWVSYLAATRADDGGGGAEAVELILRKEVKADSDSSLIEDAQMLMGSLRDSLHRLVAASAERSPAAAPDLQRLSEQVAAIRDMVQRIHPTAAGSTASDDAGQAHAASLPGPSNPPAGAVLPLLPDAATAEAALAEAERFFVAVEPSSPCLLLLRQARALAGRSFFEALQVLVPESADKAVFAFGSAPAFDLPLARIAAAAKERSASNSDEVVPRSVAARSFGKVTSRSDVLSLLDQVSAFYRFVEPSSPIPLLVDRARALSGKDFAALLKAMLPEKSEGSAW